VGGGVKVHREWLQNLQQSLEQLDSLIVPEGPYAGWSAEEAFEDQHFLEKASKWRPGSGAMAEPKRKIMVWAKMVKAFMGLEGKGGGNNVPVVEPPMPENEMVGDAPRVADEPPVIVLEVAAPPDGSELQPLVLAPERPAEQEQQNRLWTIVVCVPLRSSRSTKEDCWCWLFL
jgi:hypothetical protein